jgi:MYXO-CTERM domain-containing protein
MNTTNLSSGGLRSSRRTIHGLFLAASLAALSAKSDALDFAFSLGPGLGAPPPGLFTAVAMAGDLLESKFSDPITLRIAIAGYSSAGTDLGYFDVDAPGVTGVFSFTALKTALGTDATTSADLSAILELQPGTFVDMVTNSSTGTRTRYASESPFNSGLRLTRANQKALGLLPGLAGGPGADGTIKLNIEVFDDYDFDPTDGIASGKLDAVAIIAHELVHGMGFISGIDHVDYNVSLPVPDELSDDVIFTPLDLFRYSPDSLAKDDQPLSGAVQDWAYGGEFGSDPYFSIDGGTTMLGKFATGVYHGDGDQAQHWKTKAPPRLGLMTPALASGELGIVTALDVTALDVIGYNAVVPEASSAMLSLAGLAAAALRRRRVS